jgi:hypothetical protein
MARRMRCISALYLAASLPFGAAQAEENGLTARMPVLGQTSCFTSDTPDRPVTEAERSATMLHCKRAAAAR